MCIRDSIHTGRKDGELKGEFAEVFAAQFDRAMQEYDDDEIGELDPERAVMPTAAEGTDLLKALAVEFAGAQEKETQESRKALEQLRKEETELRKAQQAKKAQTTTNEQHEVDENEEADEWDLVALKGKSEAEWDCESILSTYSNLENHPKILGEEESIKKKPKKIQLSSRSGIPLGVLPKKKEKKKELPKKSRNLGAPRPKGEAAEMKRQRKRELKEQRRQRREEKKLTKIAYKQEELAQKKAHSLQGRQSVIRY
eukprot:TRINITY_DN2011_c0_g1_i1.p1 TRINITY_DN2011_c0_g1~~TRINITY_DN2011_c0_g1_i1.p1  ORF type:complete len:256 (+),score=98.70 TRINITY_DN2011_c0_g1_i1:46-813(+)